MDAEARILKQDGQDSEEEFRISECGFRIMSRRSSPMNTDQEKERMNQYQIF
jgi:hypothetical protein